jgi:hypothetical protein
LRDHEVFRSPRPLDLTRKVVKQTPAHWRKYLPASEHEQLELLPLGEPAGPGWCVYREHIGDSPDIEVLCGGQNSKVPSAAAVWRQGFLLHFGFEPGPAQLNDNGKALLENCIVYVARFAGDRPLTRTPSPFVDPQYPRPLRYLRFALDQQTAKPAEVARHLAAPWDARAAAMSIEELRQWVEQNDDWLCAGARGLATLDEEAKSLGIAIGQPSFFADSKRALGSATTADRARTWLAARVPDGPGAGSTPATWRAFLEANEPFLFFLEEGGFQWHLDPLAKARGVPWRELRGPLRAAAAR